MKLCVLIPAHNESKTIGQLVEQIRQKNLDVIVIDDGSSDQTGSIAQTRDAYVIQHHEKKGKGVSLRDGFRYVLSNNYDGVITMDGDGQHDVADLNTIIHKAESCPEAIVVGNRMTDIKGMPGIRLMTNRFMSFLISALCRQHIPDSQCGYRYIGRKVLESMTITAKDYEIESEVLIQASKKGYRIFSVPIRTVYGNERSKINPLRDTTRFFVYLIKELFR